MTNDNGYMSLIPENTFTEKQIAQIKKDLDRVMKCGTERIALCDGTYEIDYNSEYAMWWTIAACGSYTLHDEYTGAEYTDYKTYWISVGVPRDSRRKVFTALV